MNGENEVAYCCTSRYEFETYKKFSLAFYTILVAYADELQAVSVDEALLDVSSRVRAIADSPPALEDGEEVDPARALAERIRRDVRAATRCEGEMRRHFSFLGAELSACQSQLASRPTSCLPKSPLARPSQQTRSTCAQARLHRYSPILTSAIYLVLAGRLAKRSKPNSVRRNAASCFNSLADAYKRRWAKRREVVSLTLFAGSTRGRSSQIKSGRAFRRRLT